MPQAPAAKKLRIPVSAEAGAVSALWLAPAKFRGIAVLAHGAGAGMTHPFMERVATECAALGTATLRYQFPYMEAGKRLPGARPVLIETARAAVAEAVRRSGGRPVIAGGKSMGGRMTSLAAAEPEGLPGISGLAFLGFPLHAAKKTGTERADHLSGIEAPMLFVQGTRDALAPLDEIAPVVEKLGARATLHIVEDGDHSFAVRKRSGRTIDEALLEVATALSQWVGDRCA
jgi:predicted alpha/beta-hydrolase family hydrolase